MASGADIAVLNGAAAAVAVDGPVLRRRGGVLDGQIPEHRPAALFRAVRAAQDDSGVNGSPAAGPAVHRGHGFGGIAGFLDDGGGRILADQCRTAALPPFDAVDGGHRIAVGLDDQRRGDDVGARRDIHGHGQRRHSLVDGRLNGRRVIRAAVALGPEVPDVQNASGFFLPAGRASVRPDGIHRDLVACGQPRQPHCVGNGGGRHAGVGPGGALRTGCALGPLQIGQSHHIVPVFSIAGKLDVSALHPHGRDRRVLRQIIRYCLGDPLRLHRNQPIELFRELIVHILRRVCRSAAGGGDRRQHPQVRRPAGVQVPGVQAHGRPPRCAEHRQVHPHGLGAIGGPLVVQVPRHRVVAVAADHGPRASGPLVPNFDLDFRHLHHLPSDTPPRGEKVAPAVAVSVFADS